MSLQLDAARLCVKDLGTSYGGTAVKDSNKRQGSERHTRFQHFITFAIHNQILIFEHWNNSEKEDCIYEFFFFYNLAMRCGYNVGGIRVRPLLVLLLSYAAVPP
jgi:hypothetical protein